MSFLKSLLGGKQKDAAPAGEAVLAQEEYKGFVIKALEMKAGGEYQLCGVVEKTDGGETKSHRFIRADRFSSKDDVAALALAKGRQLVDEQSRTLF